MSQKMSTSAAKPGGVALPVTPGGLRTPSVCRVEVLDKGGERGANDRSRWTTVVDWGC